MIEWSFYAYNIMLFGLKIAPVVYLRILIIAFHDIIHKFLEVYIDDWMVYSFLKNHSSFLKVMFDHYRKLQISLNLMKCIFTIPFGTFLGHIVWKEAVCVGLTKVEVILNMPPPTSVK